MKRIEEDHQWEIDQLKKELNKLDQNLPVGTPELIWFEQEVRSIKEAHKKKFIREIMFFWGISLVIVALVLLMIYRIPIVYFALQLAMLLGMVIVFRCIKRKKRVDEL